MRKTGSSLPVVLALTTLTGCNTSEALIPKVDVGESSTAYASNDDQYRNEPAPASTAYSPTPPAYEAYGGSQANTLQAQADAIAAGKPTGTPPPQTWQQQTASSTSPAQPQELSPPPQQQPASTLAPQAAQPMPPAQPQTTQQQPVQQASLSPSATAAADTIRFLPIIGAPVEAVTPLSRQLGAEARAHGLAIKSSSDPSTQHILKGYFSAFADGDKVNVVYVWDVLDGSGARLHRIQGQQSVPSSASDPWAGVPASVMQQIGTSTIAEYLTWKQSTAG